MKASFLGQTPVPPWVFFLIADGVLGGAQLNAADFMVAPSLALILYRPDVLPLFEGRPALELVDRLLPEPAQASKRRRDNAAS